jgi:serine/threonine-protein kinase
LPARADEPSGGGEVRPGASAPTESEAAVAAHARASERLEAACDFAAAGAEALAGGDPRRALRLATLAGDDALAERAITALLVDRDEAARAAADLTARGQPGYAGAILERLGDLLGAARAHAAAGDARRAAACFEQAERPREAAQALEGALRARPDDAACRLALGELLARHGRVEAAARALQRIAATAPERVAALPLLARCLGELGLDEAARSARDELARLPAAARPSGGAEVDPASRRAPTLPPPAAAPARTAPPRSSVAGTLLFGRYDAVREVASSVHARVYEAVDRVTGERVAVKIFVGAAEGAGRDALLRFEREARALERLRHPQVVPMREYLPEGPALVLPWMPGGSLADRLRAGSATGTSPITPARAAEIVGAVLAALGEAHRLGVLHRDVKPANVLFDEAGAARLSDFGAAHLGDLSSTATAGAIGTFAYMSPEQRLGRPATIASDVYGAGAILAELLTGEPPGLAAEGPLAVAPSACHPELGAAHDRIVARLLAPEPKSRPADAFEARRLLESVAWPDRPAPPRTGAPRRASSDRPAPGERARLTEAASTSDGRDAARRRHDAWVQRDVLVVPLDDDGAELARARAFARAGHPALPTVLRADLDARELWVAPPLGRALADTGAAPTPAAIARLCAAVDALHAAGGAHGAIDAEHLYLEDGDLALAYPRERPPDVDEATARDREALASLELAAPRRAGTA